MSPEQKGRSAPRFPRAEHTPLPSRFHANYHDIFGSDSNRLKPNLGILVPGSILSIPLEGDRISPISSPSHLDELGNDLRAFYEGFDIEGPEESFAIGARVEQLLDDPYLGVDCVTVVAPSEEMGGLLIKDLIMPTFSLQIALRRSPDIVRVDTKFSTLPLDKKGIVKPVVTLDMNLLRLR